MPCRLPGSIPAFLRCPFSALLHISRTLLQSAGSPSFLQPSDTDEYPELRSCLTSKVQDNKLVVVDALTLADVKTKEMQKVLTNLKAEKALVITATDDKNVILSARNITDVQTATPSTINVYDVMNHNTVIVTKDAVASIEEVYA